MPLPNRERRRLLTLLATAIPTAMAASPAWLRAEPSRPRDVETLDFDWTDTARRREVPIRLYLPAADPGAPAHPTPWVVFSHGLGGSRYGYSHLGRHWAAQGLASLHVQHRGSDRAVWTSNWFDLVGNLRAAATDENAIARVEDVRFAITAALADPGFGARLDPARVAVAGHSYGANTALLLAGATVARVVDGERQSLSFRDERVRAAVLMSVPPFYGDSNWKAILAPVRIPTLHLTGTEDVIRIPGYRSDAQDRARLFEAMPQGPGAAATALAVFQGGTHSIFTDRTDSAGWELNRTVKAATRELSTLFLQAALGDGRFDAVDRWLETHGTLFAQTRRVQAAAVPGRSS